MNKPHSHTNKESLNSQYNLAIYSDNEDLMGFTNISYKYFALCYTAYLYRQINSTHLNTEEYKQDVNTKVSKKIEKEYISNCVRPLINSLPSDIQDSDPCIIEFNSKINKCNAFILKRRNGDLLSSEELFLYKESINAALEAAHQIITKYGNKYNKIYKTLIYNTTFNTNNWYKASKDISKLISVSEYSSILFNRRNLSTEASTSLNEYDKNVEPLGFMIFSMFNTTTNIIYNHPDSIQSDLENINTLMKRLRHSSDSYIIDNYKERIIATLYSVLKSYYKNINTNVIENFISNSKNCTIDNIYVLVNNVWELLTIVKRFSDKRYKMIDNYTKKRKEWPKRKYQINKIVYNIEEPIFELYFRPYDIPYYKLTYYIIRTAHLLHKHINTN